MVFFLKKKHLVVRKWEKENQRQKKKKIEEIFFSFIMIYYFWISLILNITLLLSIQVQCWIVRAVVGLRKICEFRVIEFLYVFV